MSDNDSIKDAMIALKKDRLGFPFEDFESWEYEDNEDDIGFCYYNPKTMHTFYTSGTSNIREWINYDHMHKVITCPFCPSSVACFNDNEEDFMKQWMGVHLAKFHAAEVDTTLVRQEQKTEYGGGALAGVKKQLTKFMPGVDDQSSMSYWMYD